MTPKESDALFRGMVCAIAGVLLLDYALLQPENSSLIPVLCMIAMLAFVAGCFAAWITDEPQDKRVPPRDEW